MMMSTSADVMSETAIKPVCPACQGTLDTSAEDALVCTECHSRYGFAGEFPDLIIGERFDDESDEELLAYEEISNQHLTENYWLPLFRRLWPEQERISLLSCGCGTGVDVELLSANGIDCVGIDCGNRSSIWHRRRYRDRFFLANGKNLPFAAETFDGAFCGCVFPHVGVVGDSNLVRDDYREERQSLAKEMSRVVKPGGKIVLASPNRLFPLDIFHGRKPGSYKPRINLPSSPFLLSVKDYRDLFMASGCRQIETLPVDNYWGFVRSKKSWKGFLLGLPVAFVFWLVSQERFKFLRNSIINPWLVVLVTR